MRNFIISLISLLIILCLWAGFSHYSSETTKILQGQAHKLIVSSINKEDWISAEKDYKQLLQTWNSYKKTASIFLDARDINEIDSTLDKAHLYMEAEDVSNSSGEFSYLKDKFKFLYTNDSISLSNIF